MISVHRLPFMCRAGCLVPALLLVSVLLPGCSSAGIYPSDIRLPPGFAIEVYTDKVPGARSLALGANGTLFVGTRDEGNVYAVTEGKGTGRPRQVFVIAK